MTTRDGDHNEEASTKMRSIRITHGLMLLGVLLVLAACDSCRAQLFPPPLPGSAPPAYQLGLMPADMGLWWPARPNIDSDVDLRSPAALNGPWTRSGVRLKVRTPLQQLVIDADDVEVVAGQQHVDSLVVMPGHRRVRVDGGVYGQIVLEGPTRLTPPPPTWRAEDMTEDVIIENVEVRAIDAGLAGVLLRGRRVALLNSRVDAQFAAVSATDTAPVQSEDIVIAGCSLRSAGDDSTVVLADVLRAALVDDWVENPSAPALRVGGESRWIVARQNTLAGGGLAVGTDPRDDITHAWFWILSLYDSTGAAVALDRERVRELVFAFNVLYSDTTDCAWCDPTPESWVVENNRLRRYESPPSRP